MSPASTAWSTVATCKIGGTELSAAWYDALLELRVELEFRVPARATLRFRDDGYAFSEGSTAKLGAAVELGAQLPDGSTVTMMSGEVTGIAVEQDGFAPPELVLTVHDKAYRLTRGTQLDTYLNLSYADVVGKIAQRHGLSADATAVGGTLDYVMQAESDFAVLDTIAERTGCDWWVDGSTLYLKPPGSHPDASKPAYALKLGQNMRRFAVRASGLHPDSVKVTGWDRQKQQLVSGTAPASSASVKPGPDMFQSFVSPGSKLAGTQQLVASGVGAQNDDEATTIAKALRDQAVAGAVVATGVVLDGAALRPGRKVTVSDAGPTSGTYHVSKVEHVYRDAFETRFVAGDRRPTSLADTLAGGRGAPVPWQHVGLVVGTVTNVNDEKKSGRVKVHYPSFTGDHESAWARTLTLGAGDKRGFVVLPEVGDEVLVGFEGGDLRQPVVLGGLFGDKSKIPLWDVAEGKVGGRRMTSRTGHVVELKDGSSPSEQHILLMLDGAKHKLRLGKDKLECEVPSGVPFTLKVGDNASIAIDEAGSLTIKAVNITLQAQGNLEAKSQAAMKLETTGALDVKGAMTGIKGDLLQLEATGPATLKGAIVEIN